MSRYIKITQRRPYNLEDFDNSYIRKLLKEPDVYIAGGFVRWLASPLEKPFPFGDIDVFATGDNFSLLDRLFGREFIFDKGCNGCMHYFDSRRNVIWNIRDSGPIQSPENLLDTFSLINQRACLVDGGILVHEWFNSYERDREISFAIYKNPVKDLELLDRYLKKGYRLSLASAQNFAEHVLTKVNRKV